MESRSAGPQSPSGLCHAPAVGSRGGSFGLSEEKPLISKGPASSHQSFQSPAQRISMEIQPRYQPVGRGQGQVC